MQFMIPEFRFRACHWLVAAVLCACAVPAAAQEPVTVLDSIRISVSRLAVRLDSLEAGICPEAALTLATPRKTGNPQIDSLSGAMERLADRVVKLTAERCPAQAVAPDEEADLEAIRQAAAEAAGVKDTTAPGDTTRGAQFVSKQRNLNIYNPEISATGDVRLLAREGVQQDNAVAQEYELAFQSSLDPYSSAKIFVSLSDEGVEVEEGYLYYAGLPGQLRLDVGKFRQQVGDLNRWHLHALPETDYPLVYQRFMGEEGLGGVGLSIYTALPAALAGGTHEVWLQGTVVESEPLMAGSHQPFGLGRLQNFWQLSRSTYAQLGFTGTAGSNRDSSLTSNLMGLDFRVTWRPPSAGNRRDFTFRLEGYRLHAEELGVTTDRYGLFADAQFKLSQRWTIGARYDYVEAARGPYADEWRVTPAITWWQSEFVYLRLQGQHRVELNDDTANELAFQFVFAMGPHKHETY
jgi:hypothetical protein